MSKAILVVDIERALLMEGSTHETAFVSREDFPTKKNENENIQVNQVGHVADFIMRASVYEVLSTSCTHDFNYGKELEWFLLNNFHEAW